MDRMYDYGVNRRLKARLAIDEYKLSMGCAVCGYKKSAVALEFHHTDPSTKLFPVANVGGRSFDSILMEIEKCVVLCSNCHSEVEEKLREERDRFLEKKSGQLNLFED